jgi:hypothetical protein
MGNTMRAMAGAAIDVYGQAREAAPQAVPLAMLEKLAERWPTLTREELDATRGRSELVAALLRAKADYAEILTREALGQPLFHRPAARSRWTTLWAR